MKLSICLLSLATLFIAFSDASASSGPNPEAPEGSRLLLSAYAKCWKNSQTKKTKCYTKCNKNQTQQILCKKKCMYQKRLRDGACYSKKNTCSKKCFVNKAKTVCNKKCKNKKNAIQKVFCKEACLKKKTSVVKKCVAECSTDAATTLSDDTLTTAPTSSPTTSATVTTDTPTESPTTSAVEEGPMVELVWDENNAATIEFCQSNETFGYRLPGATTCGPSGLVVRVVPGESYELTLSNAADQVTNLHTHGLHISGDGNADDVTRFVDPGYCLTYHWSIPDDHMGGTHWIHSHVSIGERRKMNSRRFRLVAKQMLIQMHSLLILSTLLQMHELTEPQVMGGAFGLLIVEEAPEILDNVDDATDAANIQAWMDNELLLATYKVEDLDAYLANGEEESVVFEMIENEWYRLRILHIQSKAERVGITFPDECEAHVVAWDGVWRFDGPDTEPSRQIEPTGAGRTDVAIRCDTAGDYALLAGKNEDETEVATLSVVAGTSTDASPFLTGDLSWEPYRPDYLADLESEVADEEYAIALTGPPGMINGEEWDEDVPLRELTYGTLQDWTISGTTEHPFHHHIHHMQTFNCTGHEDGQYYDTIVAENDDCRIRYIASGYSGRTVMHCHNVEHEDHGMMVWYNVTDGPLSSIQSEVDRDQKICSA